MLIPVIEASNSLPPGISSCSPFVYAQNKLQFEVRNLVIGPLDDNYNTLVDLLNNGVQRVMIDANSKEELKNVENEFPDRVVGRFVCKSVSEILPSHCERFTHVCLQEEEALEKDKAHIISRLKAFSAIISSKKVKSITYDVGKSLANLANDAEFVGELHKIDKDRPIHLLSSSTPVALDVLCRGFVACITKSEPNQTLFPTVVVDELGIALGLVYSNEASILESIVSGRATYWSRSRNALWKKGETSGDVQFLHKIELDCDSDALRFTVHQGGNGCFCHKGTRTCWGEDSGVANLFRVLESRKKDAPEGSYTKRLYDDASFLRDKLLEESQELCEALQGVKAGTDNSKHVAEETADVLYMALVACCAGNATLPMVQQILDGRSLKVKRRKGDAKVERINAGEERLKEIKKMKTTE